MGSGQYSSSSTTDIPAIHEERICRPDCYKHTIHQSWQIKKSSRECNYVARKSGNMPVPSARSSYPVSRLKYSLQLLCLYHVRRAQDFHQSSVTTSNPSHWLLMACRKP